MRIGRALTRHPGRNRENAVQDSPYAPKPSLSERRASCMKLVERRRRVDISDTVAAGGA